MSRLGKRGYVRDVEKIMQAIKEVKIDHKSVASASRQYNISRRALGRFIAKLDDQKINISKIADSDLHEKVEKMSALGKTTVCQ